MLLRIPLRLGGPVEVVVGDLEVVLARHLGRVADPRTDTLDRVRLGQFGLTTGAQVLERLDPGRQAGAADDAVCVCP